MNFEDKITDKNLINLDQLEKSLVRTKQYIDDRAAVDSKKYINADSQKELLNTLRDAFGGSWGMNWNEEKGIYEYYGWHNLSSGEKPIHVGYCGWNKSIEEGIKDAMRYYSSTDNNSNFIILYTISSSDDENSSTSYYTFQKSNVYDNDYEGSETLWTCVKYDTIYTLSRDTDGEWSIRQEVYYATKNDLNGLGGGTESISKKIYTINIDTADWDGLDFTKLTKVTNSQKELSDILNDLSLDEDIQIYCEFNFQGGTITFEIPNTLVVDGSAMLMTSFDQLWKGDGSTGHLLMTLSSNDYVLMFTDQTHLSGIEIVEKLIPVIRGRIKLTADGSIKIDGDDTNGIIKISADTNVLATKEHVNTEVEKLQEAINAKPKVEVCDNQYEFDQILTKDLNTLYLIKGDQDQWFSKEDGDELYDFYGELLERVKELERLNGITNYNNDDE